MGFFDLVREDLLKVVEDSGVKGYILEAFNATFIALIPKSAHPKNFKEFRPISFHNVMYKIIRLSTMISTRWINKVTIVCGAQLVTNNQVPF